MRFLILSALALSLQSQDAIDRAKSDSQRSAHYHTLVATVEAMHAKHDPPIRKAEIELDAFVAQWRADCQARGQILGPGRCVDAPAQQQSRHPAPPKGDK